MPALARLPRYVVALPARLGAGPALGGWLVGRAIMLHWITWMSAN